MSEEKTSAWGFGGRGPAEAESPRGEAEDLLVESADNAPSSRYDMVQIAPVERFNCLLKNGQKLRLGCWVMLRHKETGEMVITGALSTPSSPNGRLSLAMDLKDFDKFSPM